MRQKRFQWLGLLALCALLGGRADAARSAAPGYKGAIVVDAVSGDLLFSDNADEISPPASMTKLMTFAVLDDAIRAGQVSLQTKFTAGAADAKVGAIRHSTSVWLKTGESFTVEDLIYAMMLQSANDAAYLVAHSVAGTVPAFVERMNAKATALGMRRTTFRTPNGFPVASHKISEGDLTTPRDFAALCRYLVLHTDIIRYTSVKSRMFGVYERRAPVRMENHDHLLGKLAGCDGLKTGFTDGAGFCLSATAQRNGHRIIAVVMGSPSHQERDLLVAHLMEQAFTKVATPKVQLATPSRPSASAPAQPPSGIHFSVPGVD